ncbi:MAG: hypothetical protein PHG97_02540 [Candidatus Margulisbacteria bacterium]|nr:hypothetical protein [Candidatus Margulisiibacteriota bacterium]
MAETKPELLKEEETIKVADLDKKIKILDGYIQKVDTFIKTTEKKVVLLKEKRSREMILAGLRGGI